MDALAGTLERLTGPDGTVLFDLPGAPRPAADTPAPPRLVPMWDNILLAYEARALVALPADREPGVYGRYDRWWSALPGAEVRIFPEQTP